MTCRLGQNIFTIYHGKWRNYIPKSCLGKLRPKIEGGGGGNVIFCNLKIADFPERCVASLIGYAVVRLALLSNSTQGPRVHKPLLCIHITTLYQVFKSMKSMNLFSLCYRMPMPM